MLRITHLRGRRAPAVEHIPGPRARLGSAPGSEVAFSAGLDPGVMPHHAEIRWQGGAYVLFDLGSPSGTFVNRARIGQQALRHGDVIGLGGPGGPELRVEILPDAPPPGVPDAEGRIDLETAQKLVQDAVIRATSGHDRTAAIVAAKVGEARARASRTNTVLLLGILLAFPAILVAAVFVYRSQRAAQVLVEETGIGNAPAPKPNGAIPTRVYTSREIYEENKAALYVLGYLQGNKIGGYCTGFAIKPDVIATNAHCVLAYRKNGGTPVVTQNDSGGKTRFKIIAAQASPGYKADSASADSPDVGLMRIDGKVPKTVTIASQAELRALGPGDDVFVLGFPGRVMDPISPSATFLQGHIGRMTDFNEQPTTADKAMLIQHDAVTRGGNSGSPIFNQYGHVIGVHAAHLDDEQEVQVDGQKTKVVGSSPFRIAMRIDLLEGVPAP
ncbi:MAG: trypsin-like peptidase domain-containing protein [Byssovorax sp.]